MAAEFGIFTAWLLASSVPVCYAIDLATKYLYNKRLQFAETEISATIEVPKQMNFPRVLINKKDDRLPPSKIFLRYHKLPE